MSRQRFLCTLFLLTLLPATLVAWFAFPASASVLRVPQDYLTIQAAVNAAHTGDTIQVAAGIYFENVVVNTTVTVTGISVSATIVDGGGNNVVFDIQADNVELRNMTIRNGGSYSGVTAYYPYGGVTILNARIIDNVVGVVLSEADGNTVEDSVFINNQMYGIDVKYSTGNVIRNNRVSESAYGIEVSDTSSSQVVNNTVSATSYGIYVPYSTSNNVSANTLTGNSWNIYLTHSNSNVIGYNAVAGGAVGIQMMWSQDNSVFNNTLSNGSYGIYLGYCGVNTVSGNMASLNDWGIELYNSTGSTVRENIVSSNTWGFYIVENSKGNYLYHNNILNNVKQVFQDLTSGQNTWHTPATPYQGNYWNDYRGTDTNGDGVGDTYLPWQGVDWYPLMEPVGFYSDVAITDVTVSDTKVYVGEIVNITVVAENQGTEIETFNVTVRYENTTLGIFGAVDTKQVADLAPDENTTLTFTWDTTDMQACVNYTIIAEASIVPNEIDTSDNTYVDGKVKVKIPGDVNGDGVVDVYDLSIVSVAYGTFEGQPGYDLDADLNEDGLVDGRDLAIVTMNYGNTCA